MALALNKSSLKQQRDQLGMFKRFLPSLDLKRQQLLAAVKQARRELADVEQEIENMQSQLNELYPLLGSSAIATRDIASLIKVEHVEIGEENVLGTRVPVALDVQFRRQDYSPFVTPFWVDLLIEALEKAATLRVHLSVRKRRVDLLYAASRKITQRVNLFEKVLIPKAEENIRRIVIWLSDQERAAVVSSKIAKKKHAR